MVSCTNIPHLQIDRKSPKSISKNEMPYESESEIYQKLRQLEQFESYRPDSCCDLTRNLFRPKRYNFFELKNSIGK